MLSKVVLFSSLWLVAAVLALPSKLGRHIARRSEGFQSLVSNRLETISSITYSDNWAGAVWAQDVGNFTSVTGTFTVPTPSGAIGDSAAIWVGIDGDTCQTTILQTGIAFTVESGQPNYFAWYEWYPALSDNFNNITIVAGDIIRLTVQANTSTSGTVMIENLTSQQTVFQSLTSPTPLCGKNAEWIVEDYQEGSNLVPFANFSTVTFTNAVAVGSGGTYSPSGALIFDIENENSQILTSVSTSASTVTIKYV